VEPFEIRFERATRSGHFGLIAMAVIISAFTVGLLVFSPSLVVILATPLFLAGAAYGLYRPTRTFETFIESVERERPKHDGRGRQDSSDSWSDESPRRAVA
jgi:hypothetical protein